MSAFRLTRGQLSDLIPWMEHLARFEGISLGVKRVGGLWHLTFEHPLFRSGRVSLHQQGVYLSADQLRPVYTRSGRSQAPVWECIVTFDGEVIDRTVKSAP